MLAWVKGGLLTGLGLFTAWAAWRPWDMRFWQVSGLARVLGERGSRLFFCAAGLGIAALGVAVLAGWANI
jgi:hypothetical protein